MQVEQAATTTFTGAPSSLALESARIREHTRQQWNQRAASAAGLWVFGYGSLIWRPDFAFSGKLSARVHGWHRALAMWSHVNRGTPEQPGLVFAMLSGGSCRGVVYRIPEGGADAVFDLLWAREMPRHAYDPSWIWCTTPSGRVPALAFTLSRSSPAFAGTLGAEQYRYIFSHARGRYGTTLDYARETLAGLHANGIRDAGLARLLKYAGDV